MARFGFCNGIGSYTSQSPNVDAQSAVNVYPETDESGWGKSQAPLYGTPGLKFLLSPGSITGTPKFQIIQTKVVNISAASQQSFTVTLSRPVTAGNALSVTVLDDQGFWMSSVAQSPNSGVPNLTDSQGNDYMTGGILYFPSPYGLTSGQAFNCKAGITSYTFWLNNISGAYESFEEAQSIMIQEIAGLGAFTTYQVGSYSNSVTVTGVPANNVVLGFGVNATLAVPGISAGTESILINGTDTGFNVVGQPSTQSSSWMMESQTTSAGGDITATCSTPAGGTPQMVAALAFSLAPIAVQPPGDNRGFILINDRWFAVIGENFYEILVRPTTYRGTVNIAPIGLPPYFFPQSRITWISGDQFAADGSWAGATMNISGVGNFLISPHSISSSTSFDVVGLYSASNASYSLTVQHIAIARNPLNPFSGTGPVSMAASPTQILIVAGGQAYCYDLTTNTFQPLQTSTLGVLSPGSGMIGTPVQCAYSDGYFIVFFAPPNGQTIQTSNLFNASAWDPTNFTAVSVFPDNIVSMIVAYRQLVLRSATKGQAYYNSGNLFPFDPVPGGFIEQGDAATFGGVRCDNSTMWISSSERGGRMAWRLNGYTPMRISNHAVEYAWNQYTNVADAVGYAYEWNGHSFWHLNFPTAGKTWEYDAATNQWHQLTSWNAALHQFSMHRAQYHVYWQGNHYVGDWGSANVYQVSDSFHDDAGDPIQRIRISPYVFRENKWIIHHAIEFFLEVGLGPQPPLLDGAGNPRGPQLMLQWSDDQGKTWSNEHWIDCGQAGMFKTRVRLNKLGRSRGRIYKAVMTDPVPWRFADASLDASPSFTTQERLTTQIGKMG